MGIITIVVVQIKRGNIEITFLRDLLLQSTGGLGLP